jgi:phage-related protein
MGNTGNRVKQFFTQTIPNTVSNVYHYVKDQIVHPVINTATQVVQTIHNDAKQIVQGTKEIVIHTEDAATGTVKQVVADVSGTVGGLGNNLQAAASSLSMPLAIGGVAALIYFAQQKR